MLWRGISVDYLQFKLSQEKIQPQKVKIRIEQLQTLKDFQILLGNSNWIWPTIWLTTPELSNLFQILHGNSDSHGVWYLTAESEIELTRKEKKITKGISRSIRSIPWVHFNYFFFFISFFFFKFRNKLNFHVNPSSLPLSASPDSTNLQSHSLFAP